MSGSDVSLQEFRDWRKWRRENAHEPFPFFREGSGSGLDHKIVSEVAKSGRALETGEGEYVTFDIARCETFLCGHPFIIESRGLCDTVAHFVSVDLLYLAAFLVDKKKLKPLFVLVDLENKDKGPLSNAELQGEKFANTIAEMLAPSVAHKPCMVHAPNVQFNGSGKGSKKLSLDIGLVCLKTDQEFEGLEESVRLSFGVGARKSYDAIVFFSRFDGTGARALAETCRDLLMGKFSNVFKHVTFIETKTNLNVMLEEFLKAQKLGLSCCSNT